MIYLQSKLKTIGYNVSMKAIRDVLSELDFYYDNKDVYYGHNMNDKDTIHKKKVFYTKYSHALHLTEKANSKYILFHADESWANQGTNNRFSFIHNCNNKKDCWICDMIRSLGGENQKLKSKTQKNGKGKRFMFSHAISRHGLLNGHVKDKRGTNTSEVSCKLSTEMADNMDIEQPTAELVMECGKNKGDYHKNMEAELYMKYFCKRKIPRLNPCSVEL